jgi:hypothetical protein
MNGHTSDSFLASETPEFLNPQSSEYFHVDLKNNGAHSLISLPPLQQVTYFRKHKNFYLQVSKDTRVCSFHFYNCVSAL